MTPANDCDGRAAGNVIDVVFVEPNYPELGEMAQTVRDAVMAHRGRVPAAAAIGVLHMVAHEMLMEMFDE